jgi:site-specific DNA-methyltransferase (adenine-specific)
MERTGGAIRPDEAAPTNGRLDVPGMVPRTGGERSVFVRGRSLPQPKPKAALPKSFVRNRRIKAEGSAFLAKLPAAHFPLVFFDPQYRGVLDHQAYGNEGARQRARAQLEQMDDAQLGGFFYEIDRILMPSGHLLLWTDKFHLCTGLHPWIEGTELAVVDLIVWNKLRMGMGYRSRRVSEYLVVMQKAPRRAKGVWGVHDIPDVWSEKATITGPHAKPVGLQARLIEALTHPGDTVIDPAAGSFTVLESCALTGRDFLGCDIAG